MQEIHGTVMHYPWGTPDMIPAILGVMGDGQPFAEYWLGGHPLAPSMMGGIPLNQAVLEDPSLLGDRYHQTYSGKLPYLVKLLSARHALSIQAHPSAEHAALGYAREMAAGIPLNDPHRVYKDESAKPELLIALTDFEMLMGFRKTHETVALFEGLGVMSELSSIVGPLETRRGEAGIAEVFLDVLSLADDRLDLVNVLLVAAVAHAHDQGPVGELARLVIELDEHFPGDPGILAACLLNRVVLKPGQAVFVPANTMHAHIHGTGVEVMANSDNVIRGGLTKKHIAVEDLVSVVDFSDMTPHVMEGDPAGVGVRAFKVPCPEFSVWRVDSVPVTSRRLPGHGSPRIALVTKGEAQIVDNMTRLDLEHGQAVFIPASNTPVDVVGDAEIFVVAPGAR